MSKHLYALLLASSSLFMTEAQQLFDLKWCIETGLKQSYSICITRNEQQISDNNATPENAGYLSIVDMSSGFSGNSNNSRNSLQDGSIEEANGINSETNNVGLDANWTVFDDFGIQAGYSRLKELQRMGELSTRMTIEDFVANLSSECYNLTRQKIRLRSLRFTLDFSKERLRIVEEGYYIDSMSRLDSQQAQVDFNSDNSKVLNQSEVAHTSRIRLNELMTLNNMEEEIQIKGSLTYPNSFLDEVDLWKNTLGANVSFLIAQKNQALSELDYKKIKSRYYPYVKLNAGYDYTADWTEVGNYDLQRRLGLSYGVTIGMSLFDDFSRRHEQRNVRIQTESQQLCIQGLELALRTDISNFWVTYKNSLDLWDLERRSLVAVQENYQIAIDRYKPGELPGIELREV